MSDPFSTEETIKTLQKMHSDNVLSDIDLFKTYVSLAYESLRDGDVDSCLIYINHVSPEYIMDMAIVDMGDDVIFREAVLYLAKHLTLMGLVDVDDEMLKTLPEAKA